MAGDIKRQRKSWTLQDRSKVSINILRANLAEEGDEDAQLDVAKRLLQESSSTGVPERSQKENARLALYWLIKSSEQGNDEATKLLEECLRSGKGLTAQNILDVKTCITTPKYEKLTFKAARLLYRKLSNGEEFITTAQLLARMDAKGKSTTVETCPNAQEEVLADEAGEELPEEQQPNSIATENEGNSINVATPPAKDVFMKEFVDLNQTFVVSSHAAAGARSAATNSFPRSSTPKQNRCSLNQGDELPQLDLQFALIQSGKKLTLNDLLNVAKDFNSGKTPEISVNEINKVLPRHKWNVNSFPNIFLLQLLILAVLGNVIHLLKALEYFTYLALVWSCYNSFVWKLRYQNFEDWKLAFESVLVGQWETKKMKMRLSLHYLLPHAIVFSVGLLLLSFVITSQQNALFINVGLTVISSIQFGFRQRLLPSIQHVFVLCLALLYYQSPLAVSLFGESIKEQLLFLHQPVMQMGDLDQLSYVPVAVDVFVLSIFATLSTTLKVSIPDIINKTIPDVALSLWIMKVVQASVSVDCGDVALYFCLCLGLCAILAILRSQMATWKVTLVIASAAIVLLFSAYSIPYSRKPYQMSDGSENNDMKYLKWEDYEVLCHRKAWSVQSPAATQIQCSGMYEDNTALVKWKGRISLVKVETLSRSILGGMANVENVVFDISIGIFSSHKDEDSRNWQNFLSGSSDTDTVAPASLIVGTSVVHDKKQRQDLIDHILNLRTGDRIEFVGKLKGSTAGSLKPQIVDVKSIQCLSCKAADYGEFTVGKHSKNIFTQTLIKEFLLGIPMQLMNSELFQSSKAYFMDLFSRIEASN